ncbi:MAG TPA: hypothetical protein VGD49_12060 [Longimicrobiales bacterium]
MRGTRVFAFIAAASATLAVIACSSATKSSASSSCPLTGADSALIAGGVYTECAVDKRAVPVSTPFSIGSTSGPPPGGDPCKYAEVQFVVGTDGKPMPGTVRALQNNYQALADLLVATVPSWRYRPALLNGEPVRQLVKARMRVSSLAVVTRSGTSPPPRPPASARTCL